MAALDEFIKVSKVAGVDQYILVDKSGNIAAGQIQDPQKTAGIVSACGQASSVIGKTRFRHVIFSRESRKNLFIFPVGNYYLGVIKQKSINNATLVDNIVNFLKGLLTKE